MGVYYTDGSGWNGKVSKYSVVNDKGQPHIVQLFEEKTGNEMEYQAILYALTICEENSTIYTDSRLVQSQVCGTWKVKEPHLLPLVMSARELMEKKKVTITWIPREENIAGHLFQGPQNGWIKKASKSMIDALLDALLDVCVQECKQKNGSLINKGLSCYENAFSLLLDNNKLCKVDGSLYINGGRDNGDKRQ